MGDVMEQLKQARAILSDAGFKAKIVKDRGWLMVCIRRGRIKHVCGVPLENDEPGFVAADLAACYGGLVEWATAKGYLNV